ncbi:MAG: pantoate--beta-alanine ligase [Patescibacteria group bacterium]|nr:pantoate--beta-alanine ligase [Patescibacteria group bacterium]
MPTKQPEVVTTVDALRQAVRAERCQGRRIGFVPTMGALHEGHLSLVRVSKRECDSTIVSIYVNPSQFGPNEDLAKYPRTLQADLDRLAACGVDRVFAPADHQVYRPNHATWVDVGGVAEPLEGGIRPGHFRGVATIVLKLFNLVQPDAAYFGQKDFQQVLVVRQMTRDLDVPVEVRVCPTVREADGLAMSSRNAYLTPEARRRACVLSRGLRRAEQMVAAGACDAEQIARQIGEILQTAAPVDVDYIALVHPETLVPVTEVREPTAVLLAVRIDGTRLIDNTVLIPPDRVDS